VQEVGGRLVVSGETVEVAGNLDLPPKDASVASKIDVPLIETPRSVTIVDRRTLDDMSAINISQAHDQTPGFTPLDERGPASARGFPVDFYDLRRDGLRTYSWSVREPVALDRIQYLRGPAAVLYGDGSPGGLVNLVLKKPLPVRRTEVGAEAGALGFGRVTGDATGPLNANRSIRFRVTGAAEWLDNGFDNRERRLTFLPALAIDLSSTATLSLDTELYHQRGRNYRHVVPATAATQDGDFSALPWDLSMASPDDRWSGWNVAPGIRLDVDLGRSSLHVAGRYTRIEGDLDGQAVFGVSPDGGSALRFDYREISTWNEYQSDAFVTTAFKTGRIEHRLVAGLETGLSTADTLIGIGPAAPLDFDDPVYGPQPATPALSPTKYDVTRVGLYLTDQMRISKALTVVPGLRWSRLQVDDHVQRPPALAPPESESQQALASPSIGVVVLPKPWFSIYSTYARGFEPPAPAQYLEDGSAPALSENESVEGGLKTDLLGTRLSVNGALFRIRRTNVSEADVRGFYRQIGEGTSHGVEAEIVGQLAPGLTARGGYAWTDTSITRDVGGFVGRDLPNAPEHKANFWLRYRVPPGVARGLMVAGGIVHVSDRFTGRDNVIIAPRYTRFDATASCDLVAPGLKLGFVAQNLTNLRYVTSGNGGVLFAGPPRRIAVQLTSSF
jgi:iron complex outermembrane receptor protein